MSRGGGQTRADLCPVLAFVSLAIVGCGREPNGAQEAAPAEPYTPSSASAPEPTCPAVATPAFQIEITEAQSKVPVCGVTVTASDAKGASLQIMESASCVYVAYGGSESTFSVQASKPGYRSGSARVDLVKARCGFTGRDVHLQLMPLH